MLIITIHNNKLYLLLNNKDSITIPIKKLEYIEDSIREYINEVLSIYSFDTEQIHTDIYNDSNNRTISIEYLITIPYTSLANINIYNEEQSRLLLTTDRPQEKLSLYEYYDYMTEDICKNNIRLEIFIMRVLKYMIYRIDYDPYYIFNFLDDIKEFTLEELCSIYIAIKQDIIFEKEMPKLIKKKYVDSNIIIPKTRTTYQIKMSEK
jgi:hypothetical protein